VGLRPRTLVTEIRYPRAPGRFPLVVFGHGFAVTPGIYGHLLTAWARAGYVVAAPLFPLENADAPGGPNEGDIVNQPADVSFVITEMLRSRSFRGRLDSRAIGVTGQSDGGNTALAVGYSVHRDGRVRAAVILSGGEVPPVAAMAFSAGEPPLLATQGTADTINPPSFTQAFFDLAPRPKYRLDLLGAGHLPPYTGVAPWALVTERTTTAFFDFYLKGERSALGRMRAAGNVPGVAALH
jgi:dienelactone hydrolase